MSPFNPLKLGSTFKVASTQLWLLHLTPVHNTPHVPHTKLTVIKTVYKCVCRQLLGTGQR